MKDLIFQLVCLTKRNHDGSFATQANRKAILKLCGEQLLAHPPYKRLVVIALDPLEHPTYLVTRWKAEGLSHSTIRNRLACLRWWAEKVNKAGMVPDNAAFGLEPRSGIATVSKAQDFPVDKLRQIRDPYVRMSLLLQSVFGTRREESIKMRPWQADHGDVLVLQGSWCKNGRARNIPIQTNKQREVLDMAKALVGDKQASLIPAHLKYVQQLHRYEWWCRKVGLHHMHGLRHSYAAQRYTELANQPPPVAGGPTKRTMTAEERQADTVARQTVSRELGHNRVRITQAYLG